MRQSTKPSCFPPARCRGAAAIACALLLLAGAEAAAGKYRYGGSYAAGGDEEPGFFLDVEGFMANVRNADNVVATSDSVDISPIIPVWDDEFAGRLRFGYGWAGGSKLFLSLWGFSSEVTGAGAEPIFLAIGPPVSGVGDQGTSFDITTEITARTIDLGWGKSAPLAETFRLEWSVSLRHASYEETMQGRYGGVGPSAETFLADKENEGDMLGARAAVTGHYDLNETISFRAGLGVSFLDGEISAHSMLMRPASTGPASFSSITDDSRSGSIRDFAVEARFRITNGLHASIGWEQSQWDGIAVDRVRNFPDTSAPLGDRDGVVFSGYKIGLHARF
ncbi:MAG: hypothetical protein GY716_02500 [bacterium]|nr:hypothetical protein [bacterium]